jgi:hypothetical protein
MEEVVISTRGKVLERRQVQAASTDFKILGSRFSPAAGLKSGQSNREKETEILYEGKLQITSTKFQINLKFQYPITETHFHFPGKEGYFDSGPTKE